MFDISICARKMKNGHPVGRPCIHAKKSSDQIIYPKPFLQNAGRYNCWEVGATYRRATGDISNVRGQEDLRY